MYTSVKNESRTIDTVRSSAIALANAVDDYTPLLNRLQTKTLLLLGEATHGTHEFYAARVALTKRLITEQSIAAVAIEGDWPAAFRVNRYVRWQGEDTSAEEALGGFARFPLWMWRNTVMLEFVEWLRRYNEARNPAQQVGFYGLDMYSMYESVALVLEYLDKVDPAAARQARTHYACLDSPETGGAEAIACADKVIAQWVHLRRQSLVYATPGDWRAEDEHFAAEQNARLVHTAEAYYRQMLGSRTKTWNLRDAHMFETLCNLQQFLSRRLSAPARIVIWEHNSHLGDARGTSMCERGQYNVGQLVREKFGDQAYLLGFTTHSGTVTAASSWDGPAELKQVRPALPDSIEHIFHSVRLPAFFLPLTGEAHDVFSTSYLQRAIGVLYLPHTERASHYFHCRLARQFDGVVHLDKTEGLEPLDAVSLWRGGEEQTYPFGT